MKTKKGNRMLAGILCLCMLLSTMPLAGVSLAKDNSCHKTHDEACGYVQAMEGRECGHKHGDDCGAVDEKGQYADCAHKHNDECGYKPAVAGKDCMHVHGDACSKETTTVTTTVETKDKKSSGTAGTTTGTTTSTTTGTTKAAEEKDEEKKDNKLSSATTAVTNAAAKMSQFGLRGVPIGVAETKTITSWSFVDGDNLTGGELVMAGVNAGNQASLEAVVSMLPKKLSAKIGANTEQVEISWSCPTFVQTKGSWPITGEHIFTAALPAGYTCDTLPTVKVILGGAQTLNEIKGEGYSFNTQTGKLTITSNEGTVNWRVDANIAADEDARYNAIKSVVINQGVTEIGEEAFQYCKNLEGASLPKGLEYIGNYAFNECIKLTGIVFPDSVTYIDAGAFMKSGLKGRLQLPTSLTKINAKSFSGCTGLTGVDFPAGLTEIANGAFSDCTGITSITLPSKLEKIGDSGFNGCSGLRTVVFESAAAPTLGENVFTGVHSDFAIYTPKNATGYDKGKWTAYKVQTIGEYHPGDVGVINNMIENNGLAATKDDKENWSFVSWTVAEPKRVKVLTLTGIAGNLDVTALSELTGLEIYSSKQLKSVNAAGLKKLTSLWGDESGLTSLNVTNCEALEGLNVRKNQLKDLDLSGCAALKTLYINANNLNSLDVSGMEKLTTLYCNDNQLTSLNFSGCIDLQRLYCQNNQLTALDISTLSKLDVVELTENPLSAFINKEGNKLTINQTPNGTVRIADYRIGSKEIELGAAPDKDYFFNQWTKDAEGVKEENRLKFTFDKDGEVEAEFTNVAPHAFDAVSGTLTIFANGGFGSSKEDQSIGWGEDKVKSVIIRSGVTEIPYRAFYYGDSITEVSFGDTVKKIGESAFERTGITGTLNLPASLEHIGEGAFANTGITGQLILPSKVKTLGEEAFDGCTGITDTLNLPASLEHIGNGAFANTGITGQLILPSKMKTLGESAFDGCTGITSLIIEGEIEKLEGYTFKGCTGLTSVTFPAGFKTFYNGVFNGCTNLNTLRFLGDEAPTIPNGERYVFYGVANTGTIYYPAGGKGYTDEWKNDNLELGGWTLASAYRLTVKGGTDETKGGLYSKGDKVTIAADTAPTGKVFDKWVGGDDSIFAGGSRTGAQTTITMPAEHMTVTATYKEAPVPTPDPDPDNPKPDPDPDNPKPTPDPDNPATDPDNPGTDPDNPATDPDNPGTDPDNPGTDPDNPGTDPDNPGTDPVDPGHKHTYGGDWLQDDNYHWQLCTSGDGETSNRAEHTYGRWVTDTDGRYQDCTVCGYRRTESTRPVIPGYDDRYIADSHTGVKVRGYFSKDAKLEIKKGELHSAGGCGACDGIRDRQNKGELIVLYDISLVSGTYTGDVTVEIPVGKEYNGQVVTIIHCKDNVVESRTLTVKDGVARGTFTSLSPFAVVKATEEEKAQAIANGDISPKTGDSTFVWLWIASMLAAAAIGAVALRKKVKN